MPIGRWEIERGELLAQLGAAKVTNAQLLRWVQAGLLPAPRREGLGRGRGGRSYYPGLVLWQAGALAALLKQNRSLKEAGWRLWLLGYPVPAFVRALLSEELDGDEAALRDAYARMIRGSASGFAKAIKRGMSDTDAGRIKAVIGPSGRETLARMLTEQRLGLLRGGDYTEDEWAMYQDAMVAMLWPENREGDDGLTPAQTRAQAQAASAQLPLPVLRKVLTTLTVKQLAVARNEWVWLCHYFRDLGSVEEPFPERGDYLWYLWYRWSPSGEEAVGQFMKACGWTRSPPSAVDRLLERMSGTPQPAAPPADGMRSP